MKRAFITGVTGQDGSYLAELLLEKGYEVYGLQRRTSGSNTQRIDHIFDNPNFPQFATVYGDLSESSNLARIITKIDPDEIYNLGAQSHVHVSYAVPEYTANVTGLAALRLLDTIRDLKIPAKYYQASSSEMFGKVLETPQNEKTAFNPQSPYAASKVFAYYITRVYRASYNMFASNGILFNHESPRRGLTFVTRKITLGLSRVKLGIMDTLKLGNLDAKRDWGYAKDYVEAIWRILQYHKPSDFVIATGETHTVREFIQEVGKYLDMDLVWEGSGLDEKGIDRKTNKVVIEVDPVYFRLADVDILLGDASKARKLLDWQPKVTFSGLAEIMVKHDYDFAKKEAEAGIKTEVQRGIFS
ncbi:GDP-mannose 4,6-dehydratase [Candidatus Woesebacteria bacterium RIFCSPHIGHO2_12_FULL_44_11]|uniref:GDP-mannose 4,6-dehydratase n=1 Tax=Candidatus Woesebacteria bacterium RIFCSPLOWO2_01_FULL_44_14 TaxID=1802525 RepID=A0A1F8C0M3_9BACT|nr:MAG: GDP-mannose 4,6-dehydratase [Candidatus Woesebacteria bacterium RIFCSPHIGHO2_12_FULL_44_11]OGM69904.1 MAG: GDP-mannose 4,6-dehydratase [Candidatus Woesebacteria bacterium RIFCSPLOWO2_01_FULL_44_14]